MTDNKEKETNHFEQLMEDFDNEEELRKIMEINQKEKANKKDLIKTASRELIKLILIVTGIILLFSSGVAKDTMNKINGHMDTFINEKEYIEKVKYSSLPDYGSETLNEVFNGFFTNTKWAYTRTKADKKLVLFNGIAQVDEKETPVTIRFELKPEGDDTIYDIKSVTIGKDNYTNIVDINDSLTSIYDGFYEDKQVITNNSNNTTANTTKPQEQSKQEPVKQEVKHTLGDLFSKPAAKDSRIPSDVPQQTLIYNVATATLPKFGPEKIDTMFSDYFDDGNWFVEHASNDTPFYNVSYSTKTDNGDSMKISFEVDNGKNILCVKSVFVSAQGSLDGRKLSDDEVIKLFTDIYK